MEKQPRAVLWDIDGTLIDSEDYHFLTWQEAMAGVGYGLTRENFAATFGQRNDAVLRGYLGDEIDDAEIKRLSELKEARYRDVVRERGIELLPGARRWLELLREQGWRQAVASSAPAQNIEVILDALDLPPFITAAASAEGLKHGKPDPEIFLTAAALVETPPANCIVVEDAPAGTEGARRAGMRAIGVLTTHSHLAADLVVRSLDHLPDDAFLKLLG
ncbi:MAG TPA: HAD-IA family hydrolase [Pyrinomonadaceae bacterium]|nr:HAD-IA family hydrolase [Pyrinomonadaceae bacterium]